jgi:hypothetical protein
MVGYLTSLRVVVCKCVRTRSERMLHATLSLVSGVGGSRIAASCADDPQQRIIARARRICRGKWMGGPGLHARDPGRCRLLPCAAATRRNKHRHRTSED